MSFLRALLGIAVFCLLARGLARERRQKVPWRIVLISLALQFAFAGLVLETGVGQSAFRAAGDFFVRMLDVVEPGTRLVFGVLADADALERVFGPGAGTIFAFAAKGLMALVFFAALMGVLYHLGVMQIVVWALARVMKATLGVSGAEAMAVAAEIFVGPTESPLAIRPYLASMTLSELNAVMVAGFATIAGTVLAIYMGILGPELAPHLITASVLTAPGAFLVAKLMLPETATPETIGNFPLRVERTAGNALEAAANGAQDGIKLALNVGGMLIAFMALVNLVNWPLAALGDALALDGGLSLERLFGWLFAPAAWLMGVDGWHDSELVGSLLGTKIAVNEFVAYLRMGALLAEPSQFEHARSAAIAAYALCGFANFGTIGIQLGGMAVLAPARLPEISRLALRAMLGGTLASWIAGAVAGAFL
jgi:CNT family concentrative nucleoside transporter